MIKSYYHEELAPCIYPIIMVVEWMDGFHARSVHKYVSLNASGML